MRGTTKAFSLSVALAASSCASLWTLEVHAEDPAAAWSPAPRLAKEPSKTDKARELAKKSADAYRRGDFKEAIALADQAYAVDPQPVLIYNKARAYEGLGEVDAAIANYEKYLELEPSTRDRGAIEQRLTTLRRQRDERAALEKARAEAPPPPPPPSTAPAAPPPPPPAPRKHSVGPYVVAGVGGVGLVTGAVVGLMALSKKNQAVDEPTQKKAMDLKDQAGTLATVSTVSFVAGGVLVAAGAAWWAIDTDFFGRHGTKSHGKVPLRIGVGPGFASASGEF